MMIKGRYREYGGGEGYLLSRAELAELQRIAEAARAVRDTGLTYLNGCICDRPRCIAGRKLIAALDASSAYRLTADGKAPLTMPV